MRHVTKFFAKFASLIVATLSCFDRVIFKGYLPFGGDEQLPFETYAIRRSRGSAGSDPR